MAERLDPGDCNQQHKAQLEASHEQRIPVLSTGASTAERVHCPHYTCCTPRSAQSWGQRPTCQRTALPFKGTSAGWRTGTAQSLTKGNAACCIRGGGTPSTGHRLGPDKLESSFAKKDLRVLADNKPTMTQQRTLAGKKGQQHPRLH